MVQQRGGNRDADVDDGRGVLGQRDPAATEEKELRVRRGEEELAVAGGLASGGEVDPLHRAGGEGELRGSKAVGESEGGLSALDGGDGSGEGDLRRARAGAAASLLSVPELPSPPCRHRRRF